MINNVLTRWTTFVVGCIVGILAYSNAVAAPSHDNLDRATLINNLPFSERINVAAATLETGELKPSCSGDRVGGSVWYRYVTFEEREVTLDTIDSDYDTILSVWQGNTHPLSEVACNDDSAGSPQAQLSFTAKPNTVYFFNISSLPQDAGRNLVLNVAQAQQLTNDNFFSAVVIPASSSISYQRQQIVTAATLSPDEPRPSCDPDIESSVWYRYTPNQTQSLAIDTAGSNHDTSLTIWSGQSSPTREIACSRTNGLVSQAALRAELEGGVTYWLQVGGRYLPETGSGAILQLSLRIPVSNTNVDTARSVTEPLPYQVQLSSVGTDFSGISPRCALDELGHDVWFEYTPTVDQRNIRINTVGSRYDTLLAVWTMQDGKLTQLACNDNYVTDSFSQVTSQVTMSLTAKTRYYLQVAGVMGASGDLVLTVGEPGRRDFVITRSPVNQTIQYQETATLSVRIGPMAGISYVSEPLVYRWYQGKRGNTTRPVGENSPRFTTPALEKTTQYWVQVSNTTGVQSSEQVTITVEGGPVQRDFLITRQPANQTIQVNETATLSVRVGPATAQTQMSEPLSYRWYQGARGDTSTPVGEDSNNFVTPALTRTTTYWVQVSNETGSQNSSTALVTVEGELPPPPSNGTGVNTSLDILETTANFTGFFIKAADQQTAREVSQNETVEISFMINTDTRHVGELADVILVGIYRTQEGEGIYVFDAKNGTWPIWDITLEGLKPMQADVTLGANLAIPLFKGELQGLVGDFTFFIGYVLKSDGSLFFGTEPLTFTVTP
ncbi:immunoglobulin domain-containing protein [Thioflexithrix psekupsensis]|uniref:Immunoglobulin domain-containing protein n=1 Tax=Thioflexithrix psekupsensis TaxID=1570016 RepID=A0A251X951_9GAMM|nr:hypothetical protein [Thioflexithrix psekupsensis]OUD14460.1 hypothetical protein TPSD3_09145 [Thioflexithrix psekupsensis]